MRRYNEHDLKKLASEVSRQYLTSGHPLEHGILKVSVDNELGIDAIKTLIQMANSLTHLELFDRKSGDSDRIIEFEPADPDIILRKVYKVEGCSPEGEAAQVKVISTEGDPIVDLFSDFKELLPEVEDEKEPEIEEEEEQEPKVASSISPYLAKLEVTKVAEELHMRKLEALEQYRDELDKIASEFAHQNGPSFKAFEDQMYSLHGKVAHPVLQDIRSCLRLPAGQYPGDEVTKVAKLVDNTTPEFESFQTLAKISSLVEECREGVAYLEKKAGGKLV